jgi:hypothetical protein
MVNLRLLTAEIVGMFVVFSLVLFLAAGTAAWFAGWAFLVLFFGLVVALSLWLLRHNPGFVFTGSNDPISSKHSQDGKFIIVFK